MGGRSFLGFCRVMPTRTGAFERPNPGGPEPVRPVYSERTPLPAYKGEQMETLALVPLIFVAFIALYLIFGSFFTVNTAQVAVITRFGKFLRVAEAGLNWKVPYFDTVAGLVSLRVNQITLTM